MQPYDDKKQIFKCHLELFWASRKIWLTSYRHIYEHQMYVQLVVALSRITSTWFMWMWSLHAIQRHNSPEYLLIGLLFFVKKIKRISHMAHTFWMWYLFIALNRTKPKGSRYPIRSEGDRWFHFFFFSVACYKFSSLHFYLPMMTPDFRFISFFLSSHTLFPFELATISFCSHTTHICLLFETCFEQHKPMKRMNDRKCSTTKQEKKRYENPHGKI